MIIRHVISFPTPPPPPPYRPPCRRLPSATLAAESRPRRLKLTAESDPHRARLAESLQYETLDILEWPRVCNQLAAFTSTSMGLATARNASVPVGRSPAESEKLLSQTAAAVAISQPLNFAGIEDVSPIIDTAMAGQVLSIREICSLGSTLRSARNLLQQLEEISSRDGLSERCYPLLEILQNCNFLMELEQKIEFCIDCDFYVILDRASEELEFIRSERKRNMENLEIVMQQISEKIFQAGGSDKPLVTQRRSRMCVAVRATHRSLLPGGVVLHRSSSGATFFMEPREAVDLNNEEVSLSNSEKIEEQAILSLLTAEIAQCSEQINYLLDRVLELDLAFARAGHARWTNAVRPQFSSESSVVSENNLLPVDIDGIQHPLLLESSLTKAPDCSNSTDSAYLDTQNGVSKIDVVPAAFSFPVPVDFKIGLGIKVVVISGPNTGGKTASMKTLGLASIMSKAGIYLPARNQPQLPWFDLVLSDIGDQQSLEQSLSTFSGHISRICKILEVASPKSLVLLDEIGSGTDPSEGVALSTSILEYLKDRVKLAVVTTHYADLTRLKEKDARFENAAMEFSLENLKPTYQILWGSMGESNALSIAKAVGFDGRIIERAQTWVKKLTPETMQNMNTLLYQSLVEERSRLETEAKRAESLHSDIMKLYHEIFYEAEDLDGRVTALKTKETRQIERDLEVVKADIDNVVQEFENQLKNANANEINLLLKKSESTIVSIVEAYRPNDNALVGKVGSIFHKPRVGEQVLVNHLGNKLVTVVEASEDDDTVLVQYGKMRVRVNLSSIKPCNDEKGAVAKRKGQRTGNRKNLRDLSEIRNNEDVYYGPAVQTSTNTLDLRGMRVEEAAHLVNIAINSRGSKSLLFIIHGMGTGVLKESVLELLRNHPRVEKFDQEHPVNYGCTLAYIK